MIVAIFATSSIHLFYEELVSEARSREKRNTLVQPLSSIIIIILTECFSL